LAERLSLSTTANPGSAGILAGENRRKCEENYAGKDAGAPRLNVRRITPARMPAPDGALHATSKMTCGFPGQVSEIEWSFVERHCNKDVYRFTRRFPSDTGTASTTTKIVEFSDSRVVVFEDNVQAVLIEPPKK